MRAMQVAEKEMASIVAQLRIRKALLSKVPGNAGTVLQVGD